MRSDLESHRSHHHHRGTRVAGGERDGPFDRVLRTTRDNRIRPTLTATRLGQRPRQKLRHPRRRDPHVYFFAESIRSPFRRTAGGLSHERQHDSSAPHRFEVGHRQRSIQGEPVPPPLRGERLLRLGAIFRSLVLGIVSLQHGGKLCVGNRRRTNQPFDQRHDRHADRRQFSGRGPLPNGKPRLGSR